MTGFSAFLVIVYVLCCIGTLVLTTTMFTYERNKLTYLKLSWWGLLSCILFFPGFLITFVVWHLLDWGQNLQESKHRIRFLKKEDPNATAWF